MALTITTGYGPLSATLLLLLRARLFSEARRDWEKDVRPTLPWLQRHLGIGRRRWTQRKVNEWIERGNCPYVVRDGGTIIVERDS